MWTTRPTRPWWRVLRSGRGMWSGLTVTRGARVTGLTLRCESCDSLSWLLRGCVLWSELMRWIDCYKAKESYLLKGRQSDRGLIELLCRGKDQVQAQKLNRDCHLHDANERNKTPKINQRWGREIESRMTEPGVWNWWTHLGCCLVKCRSLINILIDASRVLLGKM